MIPLDHKICRKKKSYRDFFDHDKSKMVMNPYRDWIVIFGSAFVLFALAVVASVYLFIRIQNEELFVSTDVLEKRVRTIPIQDLEEVVMYFEEKKTTHEATRASAGSIVDPSL